MCDWSLFGSLYSFCLCCHSDRYYCQHCQAFPFATTFEKDQRWQTRSGRWKHERTCRCRPEGPQPLVEEYAPQPQPRVEREDEDEDEDEPQDLIDAPQPQPQDDERDSEGDWDWDYEDKNAAGPSADVASVSPPPQPYLVEPEVGTRDPFRFPRHWRSTVADVMKHDVKYLPRWSKSWTMDRFGSSSKSRLWGVIASYSTVSELPSSSFSSSSSFSVSSSS